MSDGDRTGPAFLAQIRVLEIVENHLRPVDVTRRIAEARQEVRHLLVGVRVQSAGVEVPSRFEKVEIVGVDDSEGRAERYSLVVEHLVPLERRIEQDIAG